MTQTAFGDNAYEIKDTIANPEVKKVAGQMLSAVLGHLEIPTRETQTIIAQCFDLATNYVTVEDYERSANQILKKHGVVEKIPAKLINRAEIAYDQIRPYVSGSILDLGCGDGRIGKLLAAAGNDVTLTDVYRNPYVAQTGLPFKLFKQGETTPFEDHQFDASLLLTVLHHSDDPIHTLNEAHRVTKKGGKVAIIESVYGVDGTQLAQNEAEKAKAYLSLSAENQRVVNIFFDHFYNRVIHFSENLETKVNVPFNFNTPDNWKRVFEANGFKQEQVIHLGIDQPTVPEYHTLHILEVQ